jgi:hypothetical protein
MARPTENLVETVSPEGAQDTAVRQWRGGCSMKLHTYIRYLQRTNGSTATLCRESSLRKSRVNEDIRIDARIGEADEEAQTLYMYRVKAIGIKAGRKHAEKRHRRNERLNRSET